MRKEIVCLDFDGVCHQYTSGWKGAAVIPDPYVPGLFEFLDLIAPHYEINVFSSRSHQKGGQDAMAIWFYEQRKMWRKTGGKGSNIVEIKFPDNKPPAKISIDDRGVTFTGEWPSLEFINNFKPWNRS